LLLPDEPVEEAEQLLSDLFTPTARWFLEIVPERARLNERRVRKLLTWCWSKTLTRSSRGDFRACSITWSKESRRRQSCSVERLSCSLKVAWGIAAGLGGSPISAAAWRRSCPRKYVVHCVVSSQADTWLKWCWPGQPGAAGSGSASFVDNCNVICSKIESVGRRL
jgi:hypothetical protein